MVWRSFLFAPGNHARRVEKAFTLGADAVILDLEDACPVAEKVVTRPLVAAALAHARECRGYVRVNALSTQFAFGDFAAVIRPGLDGIVLPKVESATDVRTADWLITQLERESGMAQGAVDLLPIIETAAGVIAVESIARASPRVRRLAFGAGDLTLDLALEWTRDEVELLPHRSAVVLASRAAGLEPPLDSVWTDLRDADGFRASARRARGLGFQGKMCIHPDQVAVVNEAFTPSAQDIERATRAVAAFAEAQRNGSASLQVDGQFIDYATVHRAQSVLALMDRIAARNGGK